MCLRPTRSGFPLWGSLKNKENFRKSVDKATSKDYKPKTFWFYPWGESITHKGVDIFAKEGTPVFSSTTGLVIYAGQIRLGGNVVLVLGPKWRFHYYAHLKDIKTKNFSWKKRKCKRKRTAFTLRNCDTDSVYLENRR